MEKRKKAEEEDYGDYVTRCICDLKHDDGFMIACDECGVWQHIECMQIDPKNVPENYLCEECEPRGVDKRRARQIQLKKREALSEMEASKRRRGLEKSSSTSLQPPIQLSKKKRKKGKIVETKPDLSKRQKKEPTPLPSSVKKVKKRPNSKPQPRSRLNSSTGSIQSLLNAASLLDSGSGQGGGAGDNKSKEISRKFSGLWNSNYSPWSDEYESLNENRPTEHVQKQLSHQLSELKSEAVVYSQQEYEEGRSREDQPQCSACEVVRRRKGVVADVSIPEDELVIEYKGLVTLTSELLSELSLKVLWKSTPCPFVYQYDKIADLDVCIDARHHGNIARFIRRSCSPNAELRHFFVEDELHFGVYALSDLSPQEEVTLAFDFQHNKCDYPVECACGQVKTACLVAMGTPCRTKSVTKSADGEDQSAVSGRVRPRSYSHVLAQDEDSNSSWTSTASHGRRRRGHAHSSRSTPLSPKMSRPTSREESSDSEGESEKRRKSLTREERKTEQVWKMFEKMEASAQRKRQQLVSEGSADSADPITSPLHTRHPPHPSTTRERRALSGGSRKAQLLQTGGKMRLSSVSSGDPLSPCDFSEPFSPPTTPSVLQPPLPSSPSYPQPLSPSVFRPTVDVSPFLHPKYLLEQFVLPWKKAFLRKWEYQKLEKGEVPDRYSYWAGCDDSHHAYTVSSEISRPRARGSLKHRWLRQLRNDGYLSDSEKENRATPPLPYKKQFLLRWEGSEVSEEPVPMATNILLKQESETLPDTSIEGVGSGCGSPLFDEFSDGEEFELPGRKRRTSHSKSKVKEPDTREHYVSPPRTPSPPPHGPHTPPPHSLSLSPPPPDSPLSLLPSEQMETAKDETKRESPVDTPTDHMTSHDRISICSDISEDSIKEEIGPRTPPTVQEEATPISPISPPIGPVTPPALQESTPLQSPISAHHMNVSDISSDMDSSLGQSTSETETLKPHPPSSPPQSNDQVTVESAEGQVTDKPVVLSESADVSSLPIEVKSIEEVKALTALAPPLSPSAKTPIKRKINLSEYRNRAKKPVERKSSTEKPSTPPQPSQHHTTTTFYPSLATPTLPTSQPITIAAGIPAGITMTTGVIPSGVSMVTGVSMTTGVVGMTGGGGPVPQFEPVSPDEGDHTPPLGTLEGQTMQPQAMMGGAIMNRDLPIPGPRPCLVAPEHGPLLGMMPGYNQPLHPQQPVWAVEQAHDPRRGTLAPGERQFVHVTTEPRPPGLISHPHFVVPPQGGVIHPQNMIGRGFPRPQHHPHTTSGGQYLPPRHPGPGAGYY